MNTPQDAGNPPGADQTQQGSQQQADQSQTQQQPQQAAQQTAASQQQATLTPEQIADLQKKAAEAEHFKKQYDALLPEFTRRSQALAQLAGSTQQQQTHQQDPLKPYVDKLVAKGYAPEDARAVAEVSYEMTQPLRQEFAQQQAALQQTNQIQYVMQQAWSKNASAFADPEIVQQVEQILRQEALKGQSVDPEYALDIAFVAAGRRAMSKGQQQTQTVQQQPGNIAPQFGMTAGFAPRQQTVAKQPTAEYTAADREIKERFQIQQQA